MMPTLIDIGIGPDDSKPVRAIFATAEGTIVMDMSTESAHILAIDLLKAWHIAVHPNVPMPHAFVVQT